MTKNDENGENLITAAEAARLLDYENVRTVNQMVQDGIIEADLVRVKGREVRRFDPYKIAPQYIRYLKSRNKGGTANKEREMELKQQKLEAEIALKESQGELHQLRTAITRGEYISNEELTVELQKFFITLKKFILQIPPWNSSMLSGKVSATEVRKLEKEVHNGLTDMLNSFVVAGIKADAEK